MPKVDEMPEQGLGASADADQALVQASSRQAVSPLAGLDPSRLDAADKIRLRNAGSNFGGPEFSRLACEWMNIQGFARPRREKGRWSLTPLGRELQGWVMGREAGEQ